MASADVLGQTIGNYRLLFRAGAGGMGEVLVAELRANDGFRKIVALKRLLPAYADAAPFLASMREEARLAALVDHPNVCQVFELVEDADAGPILVMEYLDGVPLRRLASAASDLGLTISLLVQACDGVHAIHQLAGDDGRPMGIVHRDINPSNMIVTPGGTLKILDFGIARADDTSSRTRTGEIKGTTPYLAPEQVLGRRVDRRADVFALGVTQYELLTGVSPFRRENEFLTQRAITDEEPPPLARYRPDIPESVSRVIAQAMARDPDHRFSTAAELGRAAIAAFAPAAIPERSAIAQMIAARFELELDERRRRIARNVEEITSQPLAPVTSAPPIENTCPLVGPVTSMATSKRSTRPYWIAAAAIAAAAAFAVVSLRGPAAPSATPPPTAATPVAATPPVDAAPPTPVPPVDAATPVVITPPDRTPIAGTPKKAGKPKHRVRQERPAASGPPGYLTIASRPFATIFVDQRRLGVTPLYRIEVPSGKRRIRADCSCGKTQRFVIEVLPGVAAPPRNLTW
ncbi:MAG: serine/threonine-protein kinase [Kofleriaceae bacterium]